MYLADLHIHSKYSRATSRDCDAPHLALWARKKGIALLGTGDFTHPAWRAELREALEPAQEGLYVLREGLRLPDETRTAGAPARFVVTGEISSIYKKNGKTRKVHSLILLPGLDAAEALAARLERVGNIRSDGRPILGLDCRDLLELTLETCPGALFIPAHIWTPHFSLFGAFSGFDSIEECFGDLSGEIRALETGLSSDPPMNWRISALDRFTLVSNSDAHSPAKLGREANCIDAPLSYPALARAIQTGEGFAGTIEFFPEEGKYHFDGHRACGVRLSPQEAEALGGLCPACGKRLTIGVQHRAWALCDRPEGARPEGAKPFEHLVPLAEVIAASIGASAAGKRVQAEYEKLLHALGPEFYILREAPLEEIGRAAGPCVAEGIRRLREGRVERIAGYDGVYGEIALFAPAERAALLGQTSLFGAPQAKALRGQAPLAVRKAAAQEPPQAGEGAALNARQEAAVTAREAVVAVIAGPGTGKTKTLIARIVHLIEARGAKPGEITAVTFTNQAAAEMRERLAARLGRRAARGVTIGTFHAVCLTLLDRRPLLGREEAEALLRELLCARGEAGDAGELLRGISRVKSGLRCEEAGVDTALYAAYCAACRARGLRDLDDILLDALDVDVRGKRMLRHLLVDEFQDSNAVQRRLVRHWAAAGESLFAIGDPDQSIYGFRGADAGCFAALRADFPALREIVLERNYRSAPQVLQSALSVIRRNPGGPRTLMPTRPDGAPVRVLCAPTPFDEAVWIAREIGRMAGGVDMLAAQAASARQGEIRAFSEIAVLCRTHRQLGRIERCLRQESIPCIISGRDGTLMDDAVRGALALFRFLLHPADTAALNICLRLAYGCGADAARRVCEACAQAGAGDAQALRAALEAARDCPPGLLADYDAEKPRLHKDKPRKLLERYAAGRETDEAFARLLDTAVFHRDMEAFLHALTLGEEADLQRASGRQYQSGAVRLMTLHGAKGLEFPVVFLAGVSEGMLPLKREGADIEEERRLLFVGMTRARDELILTAADPPSDFLRELPEQAERLRAAARKRPEATRQLRLF